ncbi:MAG: 50S ribosomal protein L13 [Deltaproteobacteria bacterium]|nr:50S ribosomal protein L13 [Deltaproteobacteria bacterium]
MQRTYSAKNGEVEQVWQLVDLEGQILGRAATRVAVLLRGKHKPQFTPHADTGDYVIAINASKVRLSGNKADQKKYYRHSGYIGNLKSRTAAEMLDGHSDELFRLAVRGMLPKNSLGRTLLKKLKVYSGPEHPHAAQQPQVFDLNEQNK